jgi:hypothetical protein
VKTVHEKYLWLFILILTTLLTRLMVIDGHYQGYSWDSGNFALAADNYSLQDGRPHLPGYYLHVQYIELISKLTGDHHLSMLILSVLYSLLATLFIFLLCQKWFDLRQSVLLTLLITSNPLVLFYGSVAEIYIFDLFFSSAILYFGISPYGILFTPVLMALGGGVRTSSAVLLLPVYVYLWSYYLRNRIIYSKTMLLYHLPALIIFLTWFIPMVASAGGIKDYIRLYVTNSPIEPITFGQNIFRFSSYLVYIAPALIVFIIAFLINRNQSAGQISLKPGSFREILYMLAWWSIPSMLFFLFFHYSKGYILLCLAALMILLFLLVDNAGIRQWSMILVIGLQVLIFFVYPYHHPDVQTYFNAKSRSMSIPRLWIERTTTEYLMSRSHISSLQNTMSAIEDAAKLVETEPTLIHSDFEYLFIDPTCPVSVRAAQAANPQIVFTKFLNRNRDYYGFHQGLVQEAREFPAQMFEKALIFSRKDFVDTYFRDLNIEFFESSGIWVIFTVDARDAGMLFNRYAELFGRY